ncbi:MAG: radical SAM protein [Nitrospirae bacterium]|nr:radical SAM protein [Nitrospirota bacterium]
MLDNSHRAGLNINSEDFTLMEQAMGKYGSGLFDEAERIFGYLTERYPDNPEIRNNYGACLFIKGKSIDAIFQFTKALDLAPAYSEATINLREICKKIYKDFEIEENVHRHLDLPELLQPLQGIKRFEGWAISITGIGSIEVYVDGRHLLRAEYGLQRDDVALIYPDINNSSCSGFRFYINTLVLIDGIHEVSIAYKTKDDRQVEDRYFIKTDNSKIRLTQDEADTFNKCTNSEDCADILDKSILLPTYFSLETAIGCPSSCLMCPRKMVLKKRKNKLMPERLVDKIFDEVDWKCKINWEWINDPLYDDRIYRFMKRAKKLGFENWIATPGYLLDTYKANQLLDGNVDIVVFSIDTLNKDLYKRIRRGLDLDVVLTNIKNFLSIRERLNSKTDVWVTKIQLPLTMSESRKEFTDYFEKLGINKVQFPAYRIRGGEMDAEVSQEVPNFNLCYFIENEMAITTDGDVVLCPCEAGAWDKPEANITEMSVRDAWLTPKRIETIKLIRGSGLRSFKECREHSGQLE